MKTTLKPMLVCAAAVMAQLFVAWCPAAEQPRAVWLAVGHAEFLEAVQPLAEWRRTQGYETVLSPLPPEEAIRACPRPPQFVLLLGDDAWGAASPNTSAPPWQLASRRAPFYRWKKTQPEEFATDMSFGDLDQDGVPEVPVGRIPAHTASEVSAAAAKILRWEKRTPALQDLSMPIWTGDPAFGPLFSQLSLGMLFASLNLHAPKWVDFWFVDGNPSLPLCGNPFDQAQRYNARITKGGGVFTAMMGHGHPDHFWSMRLDGKSIHYGIRDATALTGDQPTPPHVIFACSCGKFQAADRVSLAEALFAAPGGPVACVAASIDSHPLTNYYTSTALLRGLKREFRQFGALWIAAQQEAKQRTERDKERLLAEVEGKLHGVMDPALLKRDQVLMYNILGDPATAVFLPKPLTVMTRQSGAECIWEVTAPANATRLLVQFRKPLQAALPLRDPRMPAEPANALWEETNRGFAFRTVAEKKPGEPWTGEIAGPGVVRFVVESPAGLHAAGVEVK